MIQLRSHYDEKWKCTVDFKYSNSSGFLVELDLQVELLWLDSDVEHCSLHLYK